MSEKANHPSEAPWAVTAVPMSTNATRVSPEVLDAPEQQREDARSRNPSGFTRTATGVSVENAEAEFAELQRELTGISEKSRRSRGHSTTRSKKPVDEEKVADLSETTSEEDSHFDLESTLRGSRAAERDAGIRSKSIGVIWRA